MHHHKVNSPPCNAMSGSIQVDLSCSRTPIDQDRVNPMPVEYGLGHWRSNKFVIIELLSLYRHEKVNRFT